jgi:hypothetical protein
LTFVAGSILELLGCRKWQRRIRDNFAKNARKIIWSIGIDFLLSASLLILPLLKAYSLDYLLVTLPDIAIGICGVAFVLITAGVLKLVIVYIEIRNRRLASKGIYSSEATVSA